MCSFMKKILVQDITYLAALTMKHAACAGWLADSAFY